jgi:hypothetical protein
MDRRLDVGPDRKTRTNDSAKAINFAPVLTAP